MTTSKMSFCTLESPDRGNCPVASKAPSMPPSGEDKPMGWSVLDRAMGMAWSVDSLIR